MKQILITMLMLIGIMSISAQTSSEISKQEQYKREVQKKLQLDYSMPDYSISKIDAKVMGPRLSKILETISSLM